MKTTTFIPCLWLLLATVSSAAAQAEPTPLATPADIPAPAATPAPPAPPALPATLTATCPMCGMASAACKDEKAAPVAAAKPPENDEAAFTKIEQDWGDAVTRHDADFLDRLEADDYTYTGPDGGVSHKADDIDAAKAGIVRIESFSHRDMKVQVYGETAVVTGATILKGTAGDMDLSGRFRWTDVFVKRDGRWQVVASQATSVGKPPSED